MRVLVYDMHSYDRTFLDAANDGRHTLDYTIAQLDQQTAALADGYELLEAGSRHEFGLLVDGDQAEVIQLPDRA